MDRITVAPLKSSSFSAATNREDKLARNLSLGPIKLNEPIKDPARVDNNAAGEAPTDAAAVPEEASEPDFATLSASAEIDEFLTAHRDGEPLPAISEVTLERFASAVEQEIAPAEGTEDKWVPEVAGEEPPLLAAIKRIAALASALTAAQPEKFTIGVHRVTGVLHRAMTFVEDEFHALLEDPRVATTKTGDTGSATVRSMKRPPSFRESSSETAAGEEGSGSPPLFPPETVERLRAMAEAMLAAGYETECTEVFLVARRNALDASLQSLGYERSSIDDVVKMPWEALQSEIATWIKAFRHAVEVNLPAERDLCRRVFPGSGGHADGIFFAGLAHAAMLQMLSFPEAVVLTKRAAEKLFKVLDMYECIRDVSPAVDALAAGDDAAMANIKHELSSVRSRLGELAAAIFCDLSSSIRADAGRLPLPRGVVNPQTRYMMNYLKSACEHKSTLEQVFLHRRRPFAAELMGVIELLHGNFEVKSRACKDTYVRSIFLVNNGQYMLKKIWGLPEISAVVGEAWARKRAADLRRCHRKYRRERWIHMLNLPIRRIKQICVQRIPSHNNKSCARVAPSDRSRWWFHPEVDED